MLDEKISWTPHLPYILFNTRQAIAVLYSLLCRKSNLCLKNKLVLYKSVMRPLMVYDSNAWAYCVSKHIHQLQILLTRVLRIMMDALQFVRNSQLHREYVEPIQTYLYKISRYCLWATKLPQ
jgi:hypothetical protein